MAKNQPAAGPRVIEGGLSVDDRGAVGFVNDFAFEGVRRFYTVSNHAAGLVRAWHAHRREAARHCPRGAAAGAPEDRRSPPAAQVHRFVLSARSSVVCVPRATPMHRVPTDDVSLLLSTATVEESQGRRPYDARLWDIRRSPSDERDLSPGSRRLRHGGDAGDYLLGIMSRPRSGPAPARQAAPDASLRS
jgi:dTDP-4-dehydrorhamnose 3,5-epimerase